MNERFQIDHNIKIDQYTRVDLVQDQFTGKYCIAKKIVKEADGLQLHQFKVEVDVLSRLHDPYMPELMDVYENSYVLILYESYIEGMTFDHWLSRKYKIWKYRRNIYLELLHEIEEVHNIGYYYVDLKPSNILIKENHAYLIDFNSCVEIGSKQIVSASSFNLPAASNVNDIQIDMYGLGKILQRLYPWNIAMRWLAHLLIKGKISKISKINIYYRFLLDFQNICICLFSIFLSVFLITNTYEADVYLQTYFKDPNRYTFMKAYESSYVQNDQSSYETLYIWIYHDWINKTIVEDDRCAVFLMEQAIQSSNSELCQYILDNVPKNVQNQHMDLCLEMKLIIQPNIHLSKSWIHRYLEWLEQTDTANTQLQKLLKILVSQKIPMAKKDAQVLARLTKNNHMNREQDGLLLEYILYLKGIYHMQINVPDAFLNRHTDVEWDRLTTIWKELSS